MKFRGITFALLIFLGFAIAAYTYFSGQNHFQSNSALNASRGSLNQQAGSVSEDTAVRNTQSHASEIQPAGSLSKSAAVRVRNTQIQASYPPEIQFPEVSEKAARRVEIGRQVVATIRTTPIADVVAYINGLPAKEQNGAISAGIDEYLSSRNFALASRLLQMSSNKGGRLEMIARIAGAYAKEDLQGTLAWIDVAFREDRDAKQLALKSIVSHLADTRDAVLLPSVLPLIEDRYAREVAVYPIVQRLMKEKETQKLQQFLETLDLHQMEIARAAIRDATTGRPTQFPKGYTGY